MFISKNAKIDDAQILDVINNSCNVVVAPPIPALARNRDGNIEYLIVGQISWKSLPENFIGSKEITLVKHFENAEPVVVVNLIFASQSTESERTLLRLFLESVHSNLALRTKAACSCHDNDNGDRQTMTGPGYCVGCTYCGPCQPGYCYRPCVCNGVQDWCYDHICC